jgi:hypothetical protein
MRLTWLTGRHRSTCWNVLKRHGVSRQRRTERPQTTRRYEWTEAGALLHIDAFGLPKFEVPGGRSSEFDRAGRESTASRSSSAVGRAASGDRSLTESLCARAEL